jgi:vanillate O-demethylase monooxygenase subunit
MRLSLGRVVENRLQCPYHGWTYDCEGHGRSPGTPKLGAKAVHYDTMERYGAVWMTAAGSGPVFPLFETDGYYHLGNLSHVVEAPFELVLDNFTEVEHTPTTHSLFGYDLARMEEVKPEFHANDSCVHSSNYGPSTYIPRVLQLLLGINDDFQFHDRWTV